MIEAIAAAERFKFAECLTGSYSLVVSPSWLITGAQVSNTSATPRCLLLSRDSKFRLGMKTLLDS